LAGILGEPSNPGAGYSTALCEVMGVPSRSADMADSSKLDTGKRFSRPPGVANYFGQAKPSQTVPFASNQFHVFRGDRSLIGEEK